jgi:hypothetical protein
MAEFEIAPHDGGVRLDNVNHACPEHGLANVPPFCPVCLGSGIVSEARLAQWQREENARGMAGG